MTKLWELDDAELPEIAWPVREVFMERRIRRPDTPTLLPNDLKKSDRGRNETLHDYLTRKGISCFCRACAKAKHLAARENNGTLL